MRTTLKLLLGIFVFSIGMTGSALAQGVTTAAVGGRVTDTNGEPLAGANVVAIHQPSGTQYGAAARADGRFTFPAVRVGGPYVFTVTFIGFRTETETVPSVSLGQTLTMNFDLVEDTAQLGEIVVAGVTDDLMNSERTGAATNISRQTIESLPTVNRSLSDVVRLDPRSTGLNSFAGRNNLYNNISIDGSTFNNVFGLASEVGGQTNAKAISLDAVEQVQVATAPYDVRQGQFTGAGISVITKAGTNQLQGSVYTYRRNEGLISGKVAGSEVTNADFSQNTTGFTIGGPIIKNKAFFFANAELGRRDDPGAAFRANMGGETGPDVSSVLASDLDRLSQLLKDEFGYDPGPYQDYALETYSDNVTARFDVNLSNSHRFNVRFNYLNSYRDVPLSNSGTTGGRQNSAVRMPFANSNYRINNDVYSVIGQLNSTIGNKYANTFVIGYTALRDARSSGGGIFPLVDIENGAGSTMTTVGYEKFTANNVLDTDIFQVSNNFTAYLGAHTVTAGIGLESYAFSNGFTPDYYGSYRFRSIQDFIDHVSAPNPAAAGVPQPSFYTVQYPITEADPWLANISATQASVYVQDEFEPIDRLKLTVGLRMDMPIYTTDETDLPRNEFVEGLTWNGGETLDVSKLPAATPLWSPRLGFNYDVKGDRSLQLRGGTGIFTGKIPFVWLSNQASNNGVWSLYASITAPTSATSTTPLTNANVNGGAPIVFNSDPFVYRPASGTAPTSNLLLNVTDPDFKFPQVWRSNLAVDAELPFGVIGTLEGIYTKDLNATYHRNANFADQVGTFAGADERPRFGGTNATTRVNVAQTAAIVLDNTDKGYQYFVTGQLRKAFDFGLDASMAYTYGTAKDLTSSVSAIANTSWNANQVYTSPNDPVLGYASNHQQHRFIGALSYGLDYLDLAGTNINLVWVGGSGFNYSYTYAGDMNGDMISGNDLIYVPATKDEIALTTLADNRVGSTTYKDLRSVDQIWEQLDAFIEQDEYLSTRRGEYAIRGGGVAPWTNRFDLGISQTFTINAGGQKNTLEISFNVINVGNMINSDWGVVQTTNDTQAIVYRRYDSAANAPVFSFRPNNFPVATAGDNANDPNVARNIESFRDNADIGSRWQAQFGIRYKFN